MSQASIVITQQGVSGPAGVSRQDLVLSQQVVLTNANDSGVRSWRWVMKDRPTGSAATINSPLSATATFTPDVAGSYLVELTIDEGREGQVDTRVAAVLESINGNNIRWPAAGEDNEANWLIGGSPNDRGWVPALEDAIRAALTSGSSVETAYELDWTAESAQDFNAGGDGTYTVDGKDWEVFNSTTTSAYEINGSGLVITKGSSTNQFLDHDTVTGPIGHFLLGDVVPAAAFDVSKPWTFWWYLPTITLPASQTHIVLGLRRPPSASANLLFGCGPLSDGGNRRGFGIREGTRQWSADFATEAPNWDVFALRVQSPQVFEFFGGTWSSGWPEFKDMDRFAYAGNGSGVTATYLTRMADTQWIIGPSTLGTAGAPSVTVARQRITIG